ncbi:hypothetical protein [Parasphingorhabdus sp.]|uniref:nuclear transport factor 2 family protein n=1 Tax=Parasphingorhabdus sp. TaxID=2709688 RepID=UPI0032EE1701
MTGRAYKTGIAMAIALIAAMPGVASACELFHGVRVKMESGSYRATLNDVFLEDRGTKLSSTDGSVSQSSYEYSLTEWLVPGQNIVNIDYDGSAGAFTIFARCKGSYDDDHIVDTVSFTSPSAGQLHFDHAEPLDDIYLKADIAGDAGLLDAVEKLQDAARAGDVETILRMHAPMIKEFGRRMGSTERITSYLRSILTSHPAVVEKTLTVTPVMGGRVYQIFGPDGRPPISVSAKTEDGSFSWPGGVYWARFGDKWAVVAN